MKNPSFKGRPDFRVNKLRAACLLKWLLMVILLLTLFMLSGCGSRAESGIAQSGTTGKSTAESDIAENSTDENGTTGDKAVAAPRIGISWVADFAAAACPEDVQVYLDAVTKVGGEPVLLPRVQDAPTAQAALAGVQALIMTGGEDISPAYYGETASPYLQTVNEVRDTSDYWLLKAALAADLPVLATCRGMQMLNIVCGGSLYQDIAAQYSKELLHMDPEQLVFTYHNVEFAAGSRLQQILGADKDRLEVNSWHHQAINKLGGGLVVTATATDGVIEGVERRGSAFVIGVQFHPEWQIAEGKQAELFLRLFQALIDCACQN